MGGVRAFLSGLAKHRSEDKTLPASALKPGRKTSEAWMGFIPGMPGLVIIAVEANFYQRSVNRISAAPTWVHWLLRRMEHCMLPIIYVPRIMIFNDGKYSGDFKVDMQYGNMAADSKGNLYTVTDGQVVKYGRSGKRVYQFTGLQAPGAVAVDANGLFYLSDILADTVKVFQEP